MLQNLCQIIVKFKWLCILVVVHVKLNISFNKILGMELNSDGVLTANMFENIRKVLKPGKQ